MLTSLLPPGATVFSDSANHASLVDGIRLARATKVVFPHSDLNALENALRAANSDCEKLIVVESIFSMDGDRARLEDLYGLADRYDAGIIVDEAHATWSCRTERPRSRRLRRAAGLRVSQHSHLQQSSGVGRSFRRLQSPGSRISAQ